MENQRNDKCLRCAQKLSWMGMWDSLFLALFKGTVGLLTRSRALTMSAVYSFHDVISSLVILVGLKVADAPKNEEHPYGHGKIENLISLITSVIIIGATLFLLVDAVQIILSNDHPNPHWVAFGAAFVSLIANEIIYRYNICAYKHLNSPAILTHAKHHRADAVSSFAVLIAILGAKMGFHFLDACVAVFEAGHLLILSGDILFHSSVELMDRSPDPRINTSIRQFVAQVCGKDAAKEIKTRTVGRDLWVDLYLGLPSALTIREAEGLTRKIERTLRMRLKNIGNVNVIYV